LFILRQSHVVLTKSQVLGSSEQFALHIFPSDWRWWWEKVVHQFWWWCHC